MNKFRIIIIILLAFFVPAIEIAAEEITLSLDSLDFSSKRDPFKSQLPRKKEPVTEEESSPVTSITINTELQSPKEVVLKVPDVIENIEEINLPEISISGVIWNTNRPQAIINGKVVDVGDQLTEITIVAIHKEQINVRYQGVDFTIIP